MHKNLSLFTHIDDIPSVLQQSIVINRHENNFPILIGIAIFYIRLQVQCEFEIKIGGEVSGVSD